jgi:hypothetical protein
MGMPFLEFIVAPGMVGHPPRTPRDWETETCDGSASIPQSILTSKERTRTSGIRLKSSR